ncbi:MAG: ankyrin repeat domain-containing protein [Gammaproteobacteria bacterium]|jgi:hypothetical protein|nr:ankyrin repeat domain-containing protein [Gammaproteobacteria bacterium]
MNITPVSLFALPPLPNSSKNPNNALHHAALIGDTARINELLQAGYDMNAPDDFGHSALDLAIYYHQTDAALLLLNQGDLIQNGVRDLTLALSLNNETVANAIVHHPQFDGDSVGYRAFASNQIAILNYLNKEQIPMPMTKTLLVAKMLAHRFSLDGEIKINIDSREFFVELEGHHNKVTALECYLSFQEYIENLKKQPTLPEYFDSYLHTLEALQFAANENINGHLYMSKLYESYLSQSPVPLFIPSGWDGHAVGIVIFGDSLYKCNRGQGSDHEHGIVAYQIGNFQGFDEALFDKLLYALGSSDFIQVELDEILDLTEIGRFEAAPQTVGNCAWFSAIESVHAILLAEMSEQTSSSSTAATLANSIYKDWLDFDLTYSLAQLQSIGSESANDVLDSVLNSILLSQHDAQDPNHIERALNILQFVENPHQLLFSIEDTEFEHAVLDEMNEYIDIYQNSHWYDYGYFWLDSYLDMFDLSLTDQTYHDYQQSVEMGLQLTNLVTMHPDLLSPTSELTNTTAPTPLRWEDIFGQHHGVCATSDKPAIAPQLQENHLSLPIFSDPMVDVTEIAKVLI